MTQLPLGLKLADHAVFESFLPGSNTTLVDHLKTLPDLNQAPVIWIYGAPSTGKSHLLQAVCAKTLAKGQRAVYLPLGDPAAIEPSLLNGWQDCDVVCLDDVDRIAGDPEWESTLFRLFNELHDAGGSMVTTADRSPAATVFQLSDLASRLSWGAVYRLQSLNEEERIEALKLRAMNRGLQLPGESAKYLLRRVPRDMESLYGLLDTLDAASLAAQRKLTVPFVRSVLDQRNAEKKPD